jgi:hypothetical protein
MVDGIFASAIPFTSMFRVIEALNIPARNGNLPETSVHEDLSQFGRSAVSFGKYVSTDCSAFIFRISDSLSLKVKGITIRRNARDTLPTETP